MNIRQWYIFILLAMLHNSLWASDKVWNMAKHVEVAGQPSHFVLLKTTPEFYRFILIDPGHTSSSIVLVQKGTNGNELIACSVYLHDYYAKRNPVSDKHSRMLSTDEWNTLHDKLKAFDFWNYTPQEKLGMDGAYWVIEAGKDGHAKQISEWSPDPSNYRALCLFLWRLSGMQMGGYKNDEK